MRGFVLLSQPRTEVNVVFRQADGRCIQAVLHGHTREVREKNSRNRNLILLAHLITGKTSQIDRSLCQAKIGELFRIKR